MNRFLKWAGERNWWVFHFNTWRRRLRDRRHKWLLTGEHINDIQIESVDRLIKRAKAAHHVDVMVRINGRDEWHQADWIKHMARQSAPRR